VRQINFASIKLTVWVALGITIGFYFDVAPLLPLLSMLVLTPILYWVGKKQCRTGFPYFEVVTTLVTLCLGVLVVGISMGKGMRYAPSLLKNASQPRKSVASKSEGGTQTQHFFAPICFGNHCCG
tara:strand:- start:5580 stop:5954 length:375 start_codon:yes stop_codon:yes gene_type:complete